MAFSANPCKAAPHFWSMAKAFSLGYSTEHVEGGISVAPKPDM